MLLHYWTLEQTLEGELPSPDVSPMVISHGVSPFPAQIKKNVDLAQILAGILVPSRRS